MNGTLFKALRLQRNLTQEEFAQLLGISRSLIAAIEVGQARISTDVKARLVNQDICLDDKFHTFLRDLSKMDEI